MVAFILSITLLPALATILPVSVKPRESKTLKIMSQLAEWVIAKQKTLLIGGGLLALLLIAIIPRNELNDVFVEYFDERIEFRTDTDFIVENLTGIYYVDYSIDTKTSGNISEPQVLADIKKFTDWLDSQKEVIHVNSVTDTFTRLNKNMHGDDESFYKLPDSRELAAQYLLLYEMSLPFGLDLNNQIDIDKKSTRISVTLETLSTKQILEFEQRVDSWMTDNIPALKAVGASPSIMFAHIGMKNIISMLAGTTIALILISLILILALKSWRYGLLSLIPNLVPAGIAFGIWALIDGEIGLALSVVTAMTLGIVVDDTIHFLGRYKIEIDKGVENTLAIQNSMRTSGGAIFLTTLIFVAGFGVLTTSAFYANFMTGLLISIGMLMALLCDLYLLPVILHWLRKGK